MKEYLRKLKALIKGKLIEWEDAIQKSAEFECPSCGFNIIDDPLPKSSNPFENHLNTLRDKIHKNAVDKGFYMCGDCDGKGNVYGMDAAKYNVCPSCDGKGKLKKNFGELLMLVVSELGEALEADRKGNHTKKEAYELEIDESKPMSITGFAINVKDTVEDEIADSIIRLFDTCGYYGIDIQWHIEQKMKYNSTREAKHGKKY